MNERQNSPPAPVVANVREVSEGIARLVREHIELARYELRESFRKAGRDLALTVAGGGLVLLGWVLLMFACCYWLADVVGTGTAFLIVAAANGLTGLTLAGIFSKRLRTKDRPQLHDTTIELDRDRHFLHRVGEIIREEPRGIRPA